MWKGRKNRKLVNKGGKKCYCGPAYMPDKWRCWLSQWFNRPCRVHDHNYRLSNGRLWSDWVFYIGMLKVSGMNPLKWIVATFFYLMVFFFGWISYYFVGEKGPEKD